MKKLLIFGANGLLGQNLVEQFAPHFSVIASSRSAGPKFLQKEVEYRQVDMISRQQMSDLLTDVQPEIIINAAAYTNVDGSEEEKELCWNTNVRGVENIVDVVQDFKPLFVQISTDYVFDGTKGDYREQDDVNPLGYYARSKMAAENIVSSSALEHIIARTQVLYGFARDVRLNFATWVISRLSQKKPIRVVADQIGNPTYAGDVSVSLLKLIQNREYGLFHISGSETASRYDFAQKVAEVFKLDKNLIERIMSSGLQQKAPRPMISTFVIDKLVNRINWEPGDIESGLKRLKQKLSEAHNG